MHESLCCFGVYVEIRQRHKILSISQLKKKTPQALWSGSNNERIPHESSYSTFFPGHSLWYDHQVQLLSHELHATETRTHHLHQRNASWVVVQTSDREIDSNQPLLGCWNMEWPTELCRHFHFNACSVCFTSSAVGPTCCQATCLSLFVRPAFSPLNNMLHSFSSASLSQKFAFLIKLFCFFFHRKGRQNASFNLKGEFPACEVVKCGLF